MPDGLSRAAVHGFRGRLSFLCFALHPQSRPVQRIGTEPKFSRELIVVVRRQRELEKSVAGFIENILF